MKPRCEDVESVEGIVKALYEVVSGAADTRGWDRERTLLHPQGRLMPSRPLPEGGAEVDVFDSEEYIASRSPFFAANDFRETEFVHRSRALRQHRPRLEHLRRLPRLGRRALPERDQQHSAFPRRRPLVGDVRPLGQRA